MSTSVSDAEPSSPETSTPEASAAEASTKGATLRGRIGLVVIGIVVAFAAGGFGIIAGFAGSSSPGIVSQTVTYHITDTSVTINYTVAKPEEDVVRCTVDAFDTAFEILAKKTIVVPAGESGVKASETLRTPRKATGARIHLCEKIG